MTLTHNKPLTLDDIIGNEATKTQIRISLGAAKLNNRALPHMLLTGDPGCGKTTTAKAVAQAGNSYFAVLSPDGLREGIDLFQVFDKLPKIGYDSSGEIVGVIQPGILFIDEAHRLTLRAQEMLGIAMEEGHHTFTTGKGRKKYTYNIRVRLHRQHLQRW